MMLILQCLQRVVVIMAPEQEKVEKEQKRTEKKQKRKVIQ